MPQLNARQRRQMLNWYIAHGENVAATCAQFGVSRATFYRWRARYAANPRKPLRAQSRRPHTSRAFRKFVTSYFHLCSTAMVAVRQPYLCRMAN